MSFFPEAGSMDSGPAASALREIHGFIPRLFRLQAAAIPEILEKEAVLLGAALGEERHLSRAQKEHLLLAVARQRGSEYGVALHREMLQALGAAVADPALLDVVRKLVGTPLRFGRGDVEQLRRAGFSEPQIVEAIVMAGLANFLTTLEFGTGAAPDFAPRPFPEPAPENISHPEPVESRPTVAIDDPDGDLVDQARAGDLAAFETLVERHGQRVYRTLAALLGNSDEARDAVQDTFLKAFQNLAHFERRARFSTWLVTIANNTGLQMLRERRPVDSLDDDGSGRGGGEEEFRPRQIQAWTDDPEQLLSKSETRTLLERSIMRLPAKYRVVLVLRDVQQLSSDEAAAALGLGIPALKARLLRGRLMLREALTPHFAPMAGGRPA